MHSKSGLPKGTDTHTLAPITQLHKYYIKYLGRLRQWHAHNISQTTIIRV